MSSTIVALYTIKVLATCALVFAAWFLAELYKLKRFYGTLRRLKIPGPKPSIERCGNTHDIFEHRHKDILVEWQQKYGNLFGFYMDNQIHIVTNDLEILKTVFVDKQNIFDRREDFVFKCPLENSVIYAASKDRWKFLRKTITAVMFAIGSNSPESVEAFKVAASELLEYIQSKSVIIDGNKTVTKNMIMNPIMESYVTTAFSRLVMPELKDCNIGANNFYSNLGNSYYKPDADPYYDLACKYPFMAPILETISNVFVKKTYYKKIYAIFGDIVPQLVEYLRMRKRLGDSYKVGQSTELKHLDDSYANIVNKTYLRSLTMILVKEFEEGRISETELRENLLAAFQASYDSLSRIYMNLMWTLGKHQDIQDKAREQIKKHGHEAHYLNQVIQETVRYFPAITNFIRRKSNQACSIKGYNFPKGTVFMHALNVMTKNAQIWPDPHKFDPDRFGEGVDVSIFASQPFGFGAKMCPGYKYALNSLKITLAEVLTKYRIRTNSPVELEMELWGIDLNSAVNEINVDFEALF